jgi:dTDP-4-dehydrorhamnose reductase
MKVVVTGSNGFVAGSVIAQVPASWEVHAIARSEETDPQAGVVYHRLDLLELEVLEELIRTIKPDAIIHTAAMANIDFCEVNQLMAEAVNVGTTSLLAKVSGEIGAKLVFCSTDTVFDGIKGSYTETDEPHAINFYAETKVTAEDIVLKASDKNVVARLSLVMGLPVKGEGNSFLSDIIRKLSNGEEVKFPENEIRTPVDVITLGGALVELADNDFGGIIHLAGSTRINRYEMALQIARELELPITTIARINSNAMPGRAPRPDDASMNNELAKKVLRTPMRTLTEGLALTLNFKTKI